jgi:DNA repair protein RadC
LATFWANTGREYSKRKQFLPEKIKQKSHMKYQVKRKKNKTVSDDTVHYPEWKHPGGKLREQGAKNLTTEELLAIIISTGFKGKSALDVAKELLDKYGSLESMSNMPLAELLKIKGLGDVKIIRIAAALELGRRTAEEFVKKRKQ